MLECAAVGLAEFIHQFEFAEILLLGHIKPQHQRIKPKHNRRGHAAARTAQRRHAEFAVNKGIIEWNIQQKRQKAHNHNHPRPVQARSISMQRAMHHRRRHGQAGEKHIQGHHIFNLVAQAQPSLKRPHQKPHQQHADNAQHHAEPNPLPPRFAHFIGLARAEKLGNHRIERRHHPHKGNVNRGKHAAAQRHCRQIIFARAAGHHRVDKADAHLRHLRHQHRQRQHRELIDFFLEHRPRISI